MTDNHRIKGVIFDLGNVLLDFDHRIAAQRLSKFTDKSSGQIYNLFFDSALTGLFEEGKISPHDFFLKVKEILNIKIPYAEFLPIWNEIFYFSQKNLEVYNLALSLKKNHKVALLSNINILHLEYIKKTFPILDVFHSILTSCELGFRKPAPEIYRKALKAIETSPQETFYTDDRIELIEGAKKLGIKAVLFTGAEQLKNNFIIA